MADKAVAAGRTGDPVSPGSQATRVETALADMEGGVQSLLFASGPAAVAAVLELVNCGSHVILSGQLHGPAYRLVEDVRRRSAGLRISYADVTDPASLEAAVEDETRMVWFETPAVPTMEVASLAAMAGFAQKHNLISVCDNSLATSCLQRPLDHGVDLSIHTGSGYLFGDQAERPGAVVLGATAENFSPRLAFLRSALGVAALASQSDRALDSLSDLAPTMRRVSAGALAVARFLDSHPAVGTAFYPGLTRHPQHDLAVRQMRHPGGALSVILGGGLAAAQTVLDRVTMFRVTERHGGTASTVESPALMTYSMVPGEIRTAMGVPDGLLRFQIGVEESDGLIADLARALAGCEDRQDVRSE